MPQERKPCRFPDCTAKSGRLSGYCAAHAPVAYRCVIEDCTGRVAAWTKTGCCALHVPESRKLRP